MRRNSGLTRTDVLFTIIIIVFLIVLAGMVQLPPNSRAKALSIACLYNLKNLSAASLMQATDSSLRSPFNQPYTRSTPPSSNNWVHGVMDWSANSDNTNTLLLPTNSLASYIRDPKVFHCPADESLSAAGPRVRSYSMSDFWGLSHPLDASNNPSMVFVFIDEHENSIDDGCFLTPQPGRNAWRDLPASRHVGGTCLSYADGRAEIHRWQDPSTRQPVRPNGPKPRVSVSPEEGLDLAWLRQRTPIPTLPPAAANHLSPSDPPP